MIQTRKANLLVVDDDRNFRGTLQELLQDDGYIVRSASNGREALALLEDSSADLTLCDWKMPDMDGEHFLTALVHESNSMPVLIMTAHGTGPSALQAMQLGAYDFIIKPLDMMKTLETIRRALRHSELQKEVDELRKQRFADTLQEPEQRPDSRQPLVGSSLAWIEVFKNIGQVARTDLGVLILGESGTGKEVVARTIHENSQRATKPFIIVNCAALPADLLESELFGHERGSFTSAIGQKIGKFEAAQGGTVFLDEIGELPLILQPKLLRVLQEHTIERVGSTKPIHIDVRVIAATNRELDREVRAKNFRADLFYRLNAYTLKIPPLRERASDVLPLAEYFLEQHAFRNGTVLQGITEDAKNVLRTYTFPGNVRELEHLISRAAVHSNGRAITVEEIKRQVEQDSAPEMEPTFGGLLHLQFQEAVAMVEKELLQHALKRAEGNKSEAARRLGLNRRLLYEKLKLYGIAHK